MKRAPLRPISAKRRAEIPLRQDFPASWPFRGNKSSIARQIGNAVPSRLAEACVRAVTGE